jgi:hypothetical protein
MRENGWLVNEWVVCLIRVAILVLGWSSVIIAIALSTDLANEFSYYTMQSNLIVLVWLTIAVLFQEKKPDHWFFKALIRGAITVYILVTFLVYAIFLESFYHPGISAYTNLCVHYLVPILFVLDWFLTEMDQEYSWKYSLLWLVYPIFYVFYTLVRGIIIGWYPYFFLNLDALGAGLFVMWVFILASIFILLGLLFVFLNKVISKRVSK